MSALIRAHLHCHFQTSRFFEKFTRGKKGLSLSSEYRDLYQELLVPKPPTGGVPCPGSGGSWGRNQRHGESKSGFRPQQISLARAAVLIFRAGVWGQPAMVVREYYRVTIAR